MTQPTRAPLPPGSALRQMVPAQSAPGRHKAVPVDVPPPAPDIFPLPPSPHPVPPAPEVPPEIIEPPPAGGGAPVREPGVGEPARFLR